MEPQIHKYKFDEMNIVCDVNSGTVHVFDDAAYDALELYPDFDGGSAGADKLYEKYGVEAVREAIADIRQLIDEGSLFCGDLIGEPADFARETPLIKAMCLNISHDCNLACKYCFASKGDYGMKRENMSAETGKKAIDFLIKNSGARRNLEVDFFGGEPLLNLSAVKAVIEYARSVEAAAGKNFRFTLTTNAALLDDATAEYLNENMYNVVLSLDGRRCVNDEMRPDRGGRGTYDAIMPKIKAFSAKRGDKNHYIRGTYTGKNLDFAADVIHLADEGFEQISVEPVVAENGAGYELKEEHIPILAEQYEKLAREMARRGTGEGWFNFFHFMIDLENGPCAKKRASGCGSGSEYVAVTPDGSIYPCHQFVGDEAFVMGNVDDGITDSVLRERFISSGSLYSKPECGSCWARFYCGGGCAANSWKFAHDLGKPYLIGCELEKKRVECAIWLYIMKGSQNENT